MTLFDVYPRYPIEPVKGIGCTILDREGISHLDFYGGHAVISIGHGHPRFVEAIAEQAKNLAFYSNSILNPIQVELAERLGQISGCPEYQLFLCNSGAEAIENALKVASFHTGGTRVIAFDNAFHGRTSLAVGVTDNRAIQAPVNSVHDVQFLPLNDLDAFHTCLAESDDLAGVIVEGIQGIAGIYQPTEEFLREVERSCRERSVPLILDEIQSGYGRSGHFFAHQRHGIRPDLITVAKGMGNGFPIGGVLIAPHFQAKHGMLGTTFGGNHLACAAALAVLNVIEEEELIRNAAEIGAFLIDSLRGMPSVREVRGAGLMIGIEFEEDASALRRSLLFDHHLFVGSSSDKRTLRLLPPLTLSREEAEIFLERLEKAIAQPVAG